MLRTYNTLIIACNMCNQPREALCVYADMLAQKFTPNSTTYNALISAHGKLGQLDKVLELYRWVGVSEQGVVSECVHVGGWVGG